MIGTIADINPVSHLVEGVRGLVTDGLTAQHVAAALLVPTAIGVSVRCWRRRPAASSASPSAAPIPTSTRRRTSLPMGAPT